MVSMTVCELELPIGTSLECERPGSTRVQGTRPCERGSFLFFKVVLFFHQQPLIRKKRKGMFLPSNQEKTWEEFHMWEPSIK